MALTTYVSGEVLTAASLNANLSFAASNPGGGLTFITGGTYSLATSASLPNNTFTSSFTNYKVIFNVTSTVSQTGLKIRFRAAGSDNTNSNYSQGATGFTSDNATANLAETAVSSLSVATNFSTDPFFISLDIFQPKLTGRTFAAGFYTSANSAGSNVQTRSTSFSFLLTTSFDSMSIFSTVSNNLTGIFRVYGYADS